MNNTREHKLDLTREYILNTRECTSNNTREYILRNIPEYKSNTREYILNTMEYKLNNTREYNLKITAESKLNTTEHMDIWLAVPALQQWTLDGAHPLQRQIIHTIENWGTRLACYAYLGILQNRRQRINR